MNFAGIAPNQKEIGRVNQKLRDSAKDCPHCMSCFTPNPNGVLLCLAHSNLQSDGKGRGIKARDDKGAILCALCHDTVDGRHREMPRQAMQAMHHDAHLNTIDWWKKVGLL